MIRNYWLRVTLFTLGGLLVGLLVALVTPKKYEGIIQVLVDQKPTQNVKVMTNADQAVNDLLEVSRARTVATQVEQLTSYGVVQGAAKAVAQAHNVNPGDDNELNPMNMQRAVSIEAATESDMITLRVRMSSQELAQEAAQQIYLSFDQKNKEAAAEVGARAESALALEAQAVKDELAKVDDKLLALRKREGITSFQTQIDADVSASRQTNQDKDTAQADLASQSARLAVLLDEIKKFPKDIDAGRTTINNQEHQRLVASLNDARATRQQLLSRYYPDNPSVQEVSARIETLQTQLSRERPDIIGSKSNGLDSNYQSMLMEVAQTRGAISALRQKLASAQRSLDEKQARLARYPAVQLPLEQLMRRQNQLSLDNQEYQSKLDGLKLSKVGRINQAILITQPFADKDPVIPNFPLNLGAGTLVGLFLGVLVSFRSESKRAPIRTLGQLNRMALQPSFRVIPELPYATVGLDKQPADPYLALLANYMRSDKRPYKIAVMGVERGTGATTAAINFALGAMLEGSSVLLVDSGKANEITRRLNVSDAGTVVTPRENLTIVRPTGTGDEMGQINAVNEQTQTLGATKDLIVVDLAPFKDAGNSGLYASGLDECILMVRAGETRSTDFLQAQQMLVDVGCRLITVVFSRTTGSEDDLNLLAGEPTSRALTGR